MSKHLQEMADERFYEHRDARARLDHAVESYATSRGLGRIPTKLALMVAEHRVTTTGEHLGLAEEIANHVGEPAAYIPPEQSPIEELPEA
jgi:hypothetical protein